MNNEATTALIAALAALRDEASVRTDNARNQYHAANDLPKGSKGKRDAITTATANLKASTDVLEGLRLKIRAATKGKARAIVEASLATLDHRDADPIIRQVLAARHDPRRQSAVYWDDCPHGVHARITLDGVGLPSYIELSMLATPAERKAQTDLWIERAKTDEGRAAAQPYIDTPDAYPLSHFGSSVTVSRGYGDKGDTYGVNGSTFSTHDDDEAARLQTLHEVAWHLRSALNGADLPKVNDLEDLLEGKA